MSWWWLLVAPLLISLLVALIQDLKAYLRCRKYSRQGFLMRYRFLSGAADLFLPDRTKVPDIMTRYKRVLASVKQEPGLVINSNPRGRAAVYLTDPALVHEFFLKEINFTKKQEFGTQWQHYNDFFPFLRGVVAEEERQAFKDFFSRDHLAEIMASLHKDIKHHIYEVEAAAKSTGNWQDGIFRADWKQPNNRLLFEVANTIIFGQANETVRIEAQGNLMFGEAVKYYLEGPYLDTLNSTTNKIFCKVPQKLELLSSARAAAKIKKALTSILEQEFDKRANDPSHKPSHNLVDVRVEASRQEPSKQSVCPVESLFRETCMYMISGVNTIKRTLNGVLYNLALYPEISTKLYLELRDHGLTAGSTSPITLSLLESLPYLEAFLKENLRTLPVFYQAFDRLILQDFTLGKYRFFKGDLIEIPYASQFFREEYFPEPDTFNPDRFLGGLPKSVPPMAFIPFSAGKRMCIGRGLAEAVVKLFIVEMLQRYEISLPAGSPPAPWQFIDNEFLRTHYTVVCTPRAAKVSNASR